MKVLLVEPDYRRNSKSIISQIKDKESNVHSNDESLWYPPLGLMKISTFHKRRNDEVTFVYGCDRKNYDDVAIFSMKWDRIYITTLFTFHWEKVVETIEFYKKLVLGNTNKIFVGGIMASLLPHELFQETGIRPIQGIVTSPKQIGLDGEENIDTLPPDYELVDNRLYATNDTFYAYTTRGCVNRCKWCGVPEIEGAISYIDIKDTIKQLRFLYGDKPKLKLMDNNTLACPKFENIVQDLIELGYGKGEKTLSEPSKVRVIDFNQGLDATYFTEEHMSLLSLLNISPMRIAFDRINEKSAYVKAIRLAHKYGVRHFSNYMLYNFDDSPKDLFERLMINIELNQKFRDTEKKKHASIYSYPMRYAPIHSKIYPTKINTNNDITIDNLDENKSLSWINNLFWTKKFIRSIEIMEGTAHGAISPTPSLARRIIGETYEKFIFNLYMPEEFLRYRNKYERKIYDSEPHRQAGTGEIEEFYKFLLKLIKHDKNRYMKFHNLVSRNSKTEIRAFIAHNTDKEMTKWLRYYLL